MKYAFIQAHRSEFKLTSMCRVLKVHRSGFYAWLHEPLSPRSKANEMLTAKIRESYDQSMGIYGSPRIFCDLREAGVACGENRVARLMRAAGIKSVRGYERPRYKVGKPALVAPNQLQRQFQHDEPDQAWVTDITYIRTLEGWLYLAVVLDLHSRAVVGWSTGSGQSICQRRVQSLVQRQPTQSEHESSGELLG